MDDLIARRATGTPEAFAQRMHLCRSELMNCLNELRQLGADIRYCKNRQSYYYSIRKISGFSLASSLRKRQRRKK